jgi:hypothetical protein
LAASNANFKFPSLSASNERTGYMKKLVSDLIVSEMADRKSLSLVLKDIKDLLNTQVVT